MEITSLIYNKLITDFTAMTFQGGGTLFNSVKKYFAENTMGARDCLIIPDIVSESTTGPNAGNYQTTRELGFRAIITENFASADTDAEGSNKYDRLVNIMDVVIDYIQKEPSSLNAWGNTNNIFIYKMRLRQADFNQLESEGGYVEVLDVRFSIFLNVIPQNL